MSIKDKYTIESIKPSETHDWLLNKHYAKRIPSISYAFGLFDDKNVLQGVCTFGSPPSPPLCIGVCGIEYKKIVIELNRLVINKIEKNQTSYFVSQCLRLMPKPLIIVSYADTSYNHHGYIYQATNWIYTGLSAKRTEKYDIENPNRHNKSVIEHSNTNYQNLATRQRPQKHRYVYFIGNKTQKKKMLKALNYKIQSYPKGNNKRYDASYKPQVQEKMF